MTRRNRSHRSLQRRRRASRQALWLIGGLFGVVLTLSLFFDEMGVRKYLAMLNYANQLERDIHVLNENNAKLRTEIDRIQHDPARIEELARERLGFVRKGETVYQAVPDQARTSKEP